MNALCFTILVLLNKVACAVGLVLSPDQPGDLQHLPDPAGNVISFSTDNGHLRSGNSTDEPHVLVPTASLKIVRRCAASALTRMDEKRVDQNKTDDTKISTFLRKSPGFFTNPRLTEFLDNADHIYVICMACKRELPAKLKAKASYLNGRLSDACFAKYLTSDSDDLSTHNRKVTLSHRVAIADAQANGFKLPLVLEEDVIFKQDLNQFDFEPIAALINDASKEWEILRLAWYDHREMNTKTCKRRQKRMCNQWVEQSMCTIETHLLHSSAAYMLPARSFDRFLTHPSGTTVDGGYGMLNQFKQTILTPTLCNQHGRYMDNELDTEPSFMHFCKMARSGDAIPPPPPPPPPQPQPQPQHRAVTTIPRSDGSIDGPNVLVPTASLKIVRRCAASALTRMDENRSVLFKNEANMAPFLSKSTSFFTDARLTEFLDNADHIYVICMACKRELPAKLKAKASYLNGRLSDECFAKYLTPDSDDLHKHNRKVTLAHKIAIADAQANNFKLPLVIEEDAVFKEDLNQFDFDPIATLIHSASKEWEILRLAWYDHMEIVSTFCKRTEKKMCNQWVDQNMCTIQTHLLHSSAAYMLPARSFDRFLTHTAGMSIDGGSGTLNQFKQTVLTPALCNQHGMYMAGELRSEPAFMKSCKVARWGVQNSTAGS